MRISQRTSLSITSRSPGRMPAFSMNPVPADLRRGGQGLPRRQQVHDQGEVLDHTEVGAEAEALDRLGAPADRREVQPVPAQQAGGRLLAAQQGTTRALGRVQLALGPVAQGVEGQAVGADRLDAGLDHRGGRLAVGGRPHDLEVVRMHEVVAAHEHQVLVLGELDAAVEVAGDTEVARRCTPGCRA
nr:hypothetical protein [Streptomyces sp. NRRL S-237]